MRTLLLVTYIFSVSFLMAQIEGNGNIITRNIPVENISKIELGLYAKTYIVAEGKEYLEITIDENLLERIEKEVRSGTLTIDQKEWIQPSRDVIIKIGAPNLEVLEQSTHDETQVTKLKRDKFTLWANTGALKLSGTLKDLELRVGVARVDAEELVADNGRFNFESWGEVKANVSNNVVVSNNGRGKLFLAKTPANFSGDKSVIEKQGSFAAKNPSARFIKFTIKNNSKSRHNFYVEGPKPDGRYFSYGFPMMPNQKRDKDWTIGTKVYKVNAIGLRTFVKEITADDEGKVVDLFD